MLPIAAAGEPLLALAIGARRALVRGRTPEALERRVEGERARGAVAEARTRWVRCDAHDRVVVDLVVLEVDAIVLVDGFATGHCRRGEEARTNVTIIVSFQSVKPMSCSSIPLTHNLPINNIRVRQANLHRMIVLAYLLHIDRNAKVVEHNVPGPQQGRTERKLPGYVDVLQRNVLPQHRERGAVVEEAHIRVGRQARIEVGHQRRNVLRGGQPRVHVLAGVEEAAGGDGDVANGMTVEGEVEGELDGLEHNKLRIV